MTQGVDFCHAFAALTYHRPFPWQRRLYEEYFACGTLPSAVDIPTGLGKTAIMAIWLLARAAGARLPRRLVYVVDRRAVVDQATEFAERLRKGLEEDERLAPVRRNLNLGARPLPISTLRGQHADNRDWMADPAAPAIVVGTVDMVGSRLLFEGYGVSRRMRPFTAGLLGTDTLVMLDEAHLARPFERMLQAIENGQRRSPRNGESALFGAFAGAAASNLLPPPFRVLPLSATLSLDSDSDPFRLNDDDQDDGTVRARLEARKSLRVEDLASSSSLDETLAERAWGLMQAASETPGQPPAVAIYCNLRRDAEMVAGRLRKQVGKEERGPHVILFVGGRRVHERQKAAEELQEFGLVGEAEVARSAPVFLVATSAGEVGVDLDADHMVCDLVAWERMVQRLGRVNRRGERAAQILVLDQGPPDTKKAGAHAVGRHKAVRTLLNRLPHYADGRCRAGPGVLVGLASDSANRAWITDATTPMPLYPALTRPLVDAWAMTSLDDHAGRPNVAPWLRGWVEDDEPQTTVVWRRYLPLRFMAHGGEVKAQTARQVRGFFAGAAAQTAEILETETSRAAQWLQKRARKRLAKLKKATSSSIIGSEGRAEVAGEIKEDRDIVAPLTRDGPVAFVLDGANQVVDSLGLVEISERKRQELQASLAGRQLVVDARLGGLRAGLLDDGADEPVPTIEDNWGNPDPDRSAWTFKVEACRDREDAVDGWQSILALPYGVLAEGEADSWLIVRKRRSSGASEEGKAVARRAQHLVEHQRWTGQEAARIADALGLDGADRTMLLVAAHHHDDGKAAERWQRAFGADQDDGPFAKTTKPPNQHLLNGYRHELKSALDAEKNGLDNLDRDDPRFDLALHLIAAHHGHARPAIGVEGYDDLPPSGAEGGASAIAMRFARLQREWGPWGLAWWEALLRAADQAASRRLDEETA